ncbi:hypothetical protein DXB16_01010 [Dorea longicatena]|uniref:Uncharacterized protein n=1 Tax=Dorea longicatena TaxID=88431 RepID=A0A3E5GJJ0_9FIRM|nr:hypothetical protein DXB16_01010 [Dorea longicatena]
MKNHRFLWLRNRTTDNRKCEKARNIKEKRTIEMFSTVSKQLVEHHSSQNDNLYESFEIYKKKYTAAPEMQCFRGFSLHSKATDKAAIGSFICNSVDLIPVIIAFQRWIIIC